jgi:hypothetical protein
MNERVNGEVRTPGRDLSTAQWRKSSYSNGQANCVEVSTRLIDVVAVRDSKEPQGGKLLFTTRKWATFLSVVRSGELG